MGQTILDQKVIDENLSVNDLYYRKYSEINGFILKVLKENGRGDGNYVVLDYIDLKEKGFLRREKFKLQYFNNALQKQWEINLPPETYINVPKPFYQITANDDFIYFFEAGVSPTTTFYNCKVTQLNFRGEVIKVSEHVNLSSRIFSTFPSNRGVHIVGHRFSQGPEYFLGSFSNKDLHYSEKKISLPHSEKEVASWAVNKSEYEHVSRRLGNNYTWLKKAHMINPMREDEAIYSQYIKIDTAGRIRNTVKVDFDGTYRNFLGIDTECFEELNLIPTIVLKGAKTGPYLDVYMKDLDNFLVYHKELHLYDIRKHLRSEYPYYDYSEVTYNHYQNVDHFKAIIYDNFNEHFILIDKVPDGTYFFHINKKFELKRIDYAKEFSGISNSSFQYGIGIVSGFSTIYLQEGFYPRKTALDFIMNMKHDNPRDYYYTILSRNNFQLLIVDDLKSNHTKAYKLGK